MKIAAMNEKAPDALKKLKVAKYVEDTISVDNSVSQNLSMILKVGFWTYHEFSLVTRYRK